MIARGMPPGLAEALTPYGPLDVLWLAALAVLALGYVVGVGKVLHVNAVVIASNRRANPRVWSRWWALRKWAVAPFLALLWPGFVVANVAMGPIT